MPLSIGIVGLPNVGKSTTLNALAAARHADVANYPFCTIEPNHAVVPVPDERLERVAAIVKPPKVVHATVDFVDIAGLVKGASKGEGLGNQFLGHVRQTAALVQIVRCFDDDNVAHVTGAPDPAADIEIVNTELILADIQTLEKIIDWLVKEARADSKLQPRLDLARELADHLDAGRPAITFPRRDQDEYGELIRHPGLLTAKPVIYAANVDEDGLTEDNAYVAAVCAKAEEHGAEVVKLCAKFEEEMAGMDDAERHAFLAEAGATESGLEQVIHHGYRALGLISFFTFGPKEAHAWTIRRGTRAPQAAGEIHTDFERGFIRAEVISCEDFIEHDGEQGAKSAGRMRLEGKDYVVQDGDVIYFRFNV